MRNTSTGCSSEIPFKANYDRNDSSTDADKAHATNPIPKTAAVFHAAICRAVDAMAPGDELKLEWVIGYWRNTTPAAPADRATATTSRSVCSYAERLSAAAPSQPVVKKTRSACELCTASMTRPCV